MKNQLENKYEKMYWPKKIVGLDEAGRGPLCGPLTVAACILPPFFSCDTINDSKKLSAKKREEVYEKIIQTALWWKVEIVSPKEIDELNIYQATKKAMEKLIAEAPAEIVLIDAMPIDSEKENYSIVHGDALSISIAAASILAKVTRDRLMLELDQQYPQYHLAKHKGYPTKEHLALLEKYGPQEFYRFSYAPVQKEKNRKKIKPPQ